ncbi:related to UDP N-acetylglucosamine transporter [Sporisorium reilianum SRZ2]|uniref:Related to UDP N-acetylglucosamine transporter n=1 Tax=Sporisorium reilianum (strain SRZ2) TaxID=999809 RepID=E6ZQZ1_SPORE|nr:related to UDP N-acetylglucosamine transporter [Sporisorium reilianum SRZ2]
MQGSNDPNHTIRKWASLLLLIGFTTATSILSQRSRSVDAGKSYSIAASVFLSELLKLVVGFTLAILSRQGATRRDSASLPLFSEKADNHDQDDTSMDSPPPTPSRTMTAMSLADKAREAWSDIYCPSAWMMGVPALVYVCQNMLQLAANSYLSSVTYQGLSQLKLVTAAIISVFLFGKTLSTRQWMCLPVLLVGVVFLTQKTVSRQDLADAVALLGETQPGPDSPFSHRRISVDTSSPKAMMAKAVELAGEYANAQLAIGASCVVLACVCGSFAGVYIESKLKSSMSVSLSTRNAQLASFALLTVGAAVVAEAFSKGRWSPLENFSTLAWITVLFRGGSGYVVSATLRYADTIMKGFATSVAIITTIAFESMLSSHPPSLSQLVGSTLVMLSTYSYVRAGAASKS